jgi:two-component system nitrate/nitrite response regulator NarL
MLKVALVDDHPLLFYGLQMISKKGEKKVFEVTEYFECGQDVIDNIESLNVDIFLSDLQLTDMSGFDLITFVKSTFPNLKTALYTGFYEKETIIKAIHLGANGIISKVSHADKILNGIEEIGKGKHFVSVGDTPNSNNKPTNNNSRVLKNITLSNREKEVLEFIKEGIKNKEIATLLNISVSTVEYHRKNIYQKLNVNNVAELIKKTQSQDSFLVS